MFLFRIHSWSVLDGHKMAVWQFLSQHIFYIIPLYLASIAAVGKSAVSLTALSHRGFCLVLPGSLFGTEGILPSDAERGATSWQPVAININGNCSQLKRPPPSSSSWFLEATCIWTLLWPINQVTGKAATFEWRPEQEMLWCRWPWHLGHLTQQTLSY